MRPHCWCLIFRALVAGWGAGCRPSGWLSPTKILVTSRVALHVWEHEYLLPSTDTDLGYLRRRMLLHNPAVALFLERAAAVKPVSR
jgi:hypothetical protein